MKRRLTLIVLLLLCWAQWPLQAMPLEQKGAPQQLSAAAAGPGAGDVMQVLFGLLLVLLLIVGLAWGLRRFGGFHFTSSHLIKVVDSLALAPRERIVLLQVGGEQVLVGITQGSMTKLHVLERPIDSKVEPGEPRASSSESFAEKLKKMLQQPNSR